MKLLHRPVIVSVHESHRPFRLDRRPVKVHICFGHTSSILNAKIVLNPSTAVNSVVDKMQMKRLFDYLEVSHFEWGLIGQTHPKEYVLKHKNHVKHLMCRVLDGSDFQSGISKEDFYWETFYRYDREFRIHVSRYGDFFSTEKVFRGSPISSSLSPWIRNKNTCVFKKDFQRPDGWRKIIRECRVVLRFLRLDFAGFDVAYDSEAGKHYLIELNTACGMGPLTREAYTRELNKITLIKSIKHFIPFIK